MINYEDFEEVVLSKIDSNKKLTEDELQELIFEYAIDSEDIDQTRWTMITQTIVKVGDRTFSVKWEAGLTECQENQIYPQVPVEVKQVEQVVKVWKPIK